MNDKKEVLRALERAGWSESRRIDTRGAKDALTKAGYSAWPALLDIEAAYSGLDVPYERNGRTDTAWFGIARACSFADAEWVRSYEQRVGSRMCPIGGARYGHMVLMASEKGRIYGGFDETLVDLGGSVPDAVANLISGRGSDVARP